CCTAVDRPNRPFCAVTRALTEENRWRAQRYGTDGTYFDLTSRRAIEFTALLRRTLDEVAEDVVALGLGREMAHLLTIRDRGTSAHLQLRMYKQLRKEGQTRKRALREVARWLQACSAAGFFIETAPEPQQKAAA
ncbi:MAG TPA: hypothetical protein VIK79_00800, partial [Xanthobacteraceae bacterium]